MFFNHKVTFSLKCTNTARRLTSAGNNALRAFYKSHGISTVVAIAQVYSSARLASTCVHTVYVLSNRLSRGYARPYGQAERTNC